MNEILTALKGLLGAAVSKAVPALLILIAGLLVIRIVMTIIKKLLEKTKLEKAAHGLVKSVARVVLFVLLGLILAGSLGIDVTSVVALASVLTLAVSLSVQNLLTNVLGGFTLLYTHPFKSGDYVEIAGQAGSVTEIGMFYTVLTTPDNKITHIPNNSVVSADITNYTTTGTRRLSIDVSASYDAPTEKVLEALRDAANVPGILEDPAPFVALTGYGDHAITYTVRVWTKTEDYWTVHYAIHERIRECFAAHGVAMTHPHLNVHLDK